MNSFFIAIIDDDDALCSSLVDLMRSSGHRAEPFASAETFLLSPDLPFFDCVIADVHLPGMNGLDLARRLGEQSGTTPVILITAWPGKRLEKEVSSLGAKYLLRKPFEATTMLDCIQRSVSNDPTVR